MPEIYVPNKKIVVASSFEGIVNNGATECALTSFNAYQRMTEGEDKFYERIIEPSEFSSIRDSRAVRAFLALRPLVEVAEDYLTVIEVIENNPDLVDEMLSHPEREESYNPLIDKFRDRSMSAENRRTRFRQEFYDERERMQQEDYEGWLNTQEPYAEMIPEFRELVETQDRSGKEGPYSSVKSGVVPWFATSKDEKSSYALCNFYANVRKLDPNAVGEGACVISRHRIIGKEHTRDKIEQLRIIARKEEIPNPQVWRVNDRYDEEQQVELKNAGFPYQFLLKGGYAFPHDERKAQDDPFVIVLEREDFAQRLGEFAKNWGY